jgi:hypothetical protein
MADIIPTTLHFIWVGSVIPKRQAACILSWMYKNPKYTVTLWTNRPAENAAFIHSMADELFNLFSSVRRNAADVRVTRRIDERTIILSCTDVSQSRETLGEALWARYEDEITERNYGGASDILRIAVLMKVGGIYLDTDSDALLELPTLTAKDGIMFGRLEGFCNAVIAAPPDHPHLRGIMDAITSDYDYWDRLGLLAGYRAGVQDARLAVTAATNANARYQELSSRENLPAVQAGILAQLPIKKAELRAAKSILQQQMMSGTLLVTGPTRIALWLYMHTGGVDTPLTWAQRKGVPQDQYNTHLKMAVLFATFQNTVVKPMLNQPDVIERYGFPKAYVKINSEASWIR